VTHATGGVLWIAACINALRLWETAVMRTPVLAQLPADDRAASALARGGADLRRIAKLPLGRTARSLADTLTRLRRDRASAPMDGVAVAP